MSLWYRKTVTNSTWQCAIYAVQNALIQVDDNNMDKKKIILGVTWPNVLMSLCERAKNKRGGRERFISLAEYNTITGIE